MIQVRAALSGDADAIAAIYAPHVLAGITSFEEQAPDPAEMARRIAAGDGMYPWLVATRDAEVIAYAYASPSHTRPAYRWTVETTIYVADVAQGQGVGRHLYRALLYTLAEQGFAQAVARIALTNDASVALHEAAGFYLTGVQHAVGYKHGQWTDVGLWQRALARISASASEPRPFVATENPTVPLNNTVQSTTCSSQEMIVSNLATAPSAPTSNGPLPASESRK